MQHSISYSAALVQMAESVPILSAPVEGIIVCCVIRYVRAANGCCGAKDHETSRLMKIWRESSVCSPQCRKTDTRAMVRDASICICLCVCDKDPGIESIDQIEFYDKLERIVWGNMLIRFLAERSMKDEYLSHTRPQGPTVDRAT